MAQTTLYTFDKETLRLSGDWTVHNIADLKKNLIASANDWPKQFTIDGSALTAIDTVGAYVMHDLLQTLKQQNKSFELQGFSEAHQKIIDFVGSHIGKLKKAAPPKLPNYLARIGIGSFDYLNKILSWFNFIGHVFVTFLTDIKAPQKLRWKYFLRVIEVNGYQALPIIGFLSFLIGVVLSYQSAVELRMYGANIFLIPLLGMAIFREFGPLITAIIVTGRTGSSFTAQIGLMKVNEEVDALQTMGISPMQMLVLPRVLGLIVAMPLLTMWADFFGILGGMTMGSMMLDINYTNFLHSFPAEVTLTSFMIGFIKAPVFAAIISSVGCYHGFQVSGSSESIGWQTTKSVVLAIFLIIVADASFSLVFSWLNI